MTAICNLAPDINNCPHYVIGTGRCGSENRMCGFFNTDEKKKEKEGYVRKPRWYEQYYRR